ncbi:MAG: phosphonate C-P lyase system protein PhnH [Roseiflexaceae bacterium]
MSTPTMSAGEARAQTTFTALMWALSQPGQAHVLPAGGLAAFSMIADALIDLETSYFTDHPELQQLLARSGARARPTSAAMYQFYPQLNAAALALLGDAPTGTYSYPDESATLIVGCALGAGRRLRLRGPGIATVTELWIDGIPEPFWTLREQMCLYPLGWDTVLVADDHVLGLPRTTQIEVG